MKFSFRYVFSALLVIIVAMFSVTTTFAEDTTFFSVAHDGTYEHPDNRRNMLLATDPGSTVEFDISVKNIGTSPIVLRFLAGDGSFGSTPAIIRVNNPDEEQEGIGAWVAIPEESQLLEFAPGDGATIPLTLTIPTNVAPGVYAGGILVTTNLGEKADLVGGSGAAVAKATGLGIELHVSGEEVIDVELSDFSAGVTDGELQVDYSFSNSGNVPMKAAISYVITDTLADEILRQDNIEERILPGAPFVKTITVKDIETYAILDVDTDITITRVRDLGQEPYNEEIHKDKTIYVYPMVVALVVFGLLALVIVFFLYRFMYARKLKSQLVDYKVKKGDSLMELAATHNMKWKWLARINKIKAPYILTPGQVIKIKKK